MGYAVVLLILVPEMAPFPPESGTRPSRYKGALCSHVLCLVFTLYAFIEHTTAVRRDGRRTTL